MMNGMKVEPQIDGGLSKGQMDGPISTGDQLGLSPILGIVSLGDIETMFGIVVHEGHGKVVIGHDGLETEQQQ